MKKNTFKNILRTVAFLLFAVAVFSVASLICERKTYIGSWNYMAKLKEFYETEESSLDYIGLGSSHMYCTLNPLEIWNETGISGFVLATQQQPMRASYYYLKEAFKTQSPKYVVLEGYMAIGSDNYDEAVLYDAIDPLKLSVNKIQMINALVSRDERPNYYFNILKYHSRWKSVSANEASLAFENNSDFYKGFVALDGNFKAQNLIPDYDNVEAAEIGSHNLDAMNDILGLTRDNGAELIILLAPYDTTNENFVSVFKAEKEWAEENGVAVLDYSLLLNELDIDPETDYYDGSHLDVSGAAKISVHFADYLKSCGLTANENADTALWKADYDRYKNLFG